MLIRSTLNEFRHVILFIGLSVLVLVGISLLPKSPPISVAPEVPVAREAPYQLQS